jgi:pimeloyl-ACP methyl ester carboxylesterase
MTSGFQQSFTGKRSRRGGSGFIVRSALVLSVLAAILIFMVILTISSSNHLMSIDKTSVSNVPSNILPSYSTCSFESFDGQTNLSGWFFKCDNPITTVIVVHSAGSNRLPFGVNMIDLIENLLDNNYNVFLFDQRNSGESDGDVCNYGYLEWQDVIGAIAQVRAISVTTNVVLYSIGTGCTSSMIAYDKLPEANLSEAQLNDYPDDILKLGFDRSYVIGMIFDSPAKNSDDYIRAVVQQTEFMGTITQNFVPYAIRISAGEGSSVNLVAEISRLQMPVCIIYGGHDTFIGADRITQIVEERNRLNSSLTVSRMIPGAGYLESFRLGKDDYIETFMRFMQSYFV